MFRELELEEKARLVLGVSSEAGDKEIKKAYWHLAMECHPDRGAKNKSLEEKFKAISEAYEILTSAKNTRSYTLLSCNIDLVHSNSPKSYWDWWKETYASFI